MDKKSSNNASPKQPKDTPNLAPQKQIELSDLDIRSAEVQEIIGRPPHWLVRMGTVGFFVVLAMVLAAASIIKYPETIKAPFRLTAINAPKAVIIKRSGKVVKLNIKNGTNVKKGQILAWLESTANHASVIKLSKITDKLNKWVIDRKFHTIKSLKFYNISTLGELQPAFQSFVQHYQEYISYLPGGFFYKNRKLLKQEITFTNKLLEILKESSRLKKEIFE